MTTEIWDECLHSSIPVELLDFTNHPTPSQLEKRLGRELTEIFLNSCKPIERVLFGRNKPLKGPEAGKEVNPADILNESECVGVPSRTECLQALTHRGILKIGEEIEEKIAQEHENAVAVAVSETEELERFEAEKRIEFHVEKAVRELNEEWQQRYGALAGKYEEEKQNLMKIFYESRKVLEEFLEKKCRMEIDKSVERAIADTKREMEEQCAKTLDDELAQQQIICQEAMKVTLDNLKANDRDKMDELRNQCLRAMDVQSHLMMCRQITELIHAMSVEKRHWQKQLSIQRKEYERIILELQMRLNSLVGELSREHQSKSIIVALWRKFFKSLGVLDINKLTQQEQRMFYEFQQIQCDLSENFDDNSSRVITLEETEQIDEKSDDDSDGDNDDNMDWIKNIDECIRRGGENSDKDSSVAVNWQRQSPMETEFMEDKFMASIFQRTSQADVDDSMISEIASSIKQLVRESTDEKQLTETLVELLRNVGVKKRKKNANVDAIVLFPKSDTLHICDSKELIERRVSIAGDKVTNHSSELLAAVDSLEVLSLRASKAADDKRESKFNENAFQMFTTQPSYSESMSTLQSNQDYLPSYMKIPEYKKMTPKEWHQLQLIEEAQSMWKSHRSSSVTFGETTFIDCNTPKSSERHSILKPNPVNLTTQRNSNEVDQQQNALAPIHDKCREIFRNMKVKSVLKMLCDDDNDINMNGIESNETLSSSSGAPTN